MGWKIKICDEPGCNYPVWSKKKCQKHLSKPAKETRYPGMIEVFEEIWEERKHVCFNCNVFLGSESKTLFFHHILEKGSETYKVYFKEKWNIVLLCGHCHINVKNLPKLKTLTDATKKTIL